MYGMVLLTPLLGIYSYFVERLPWYVVLAPWTLLVLGLVGVVAYLYTTKTNPFQ